MENIKDIIFFAIGVTLVFGLMSSIFNFIDDLFAGRSKTVVGRPTGKVMQISENDELVEYEKEGRPGETVVRRRGRG